VKDAEMDVSSGPVLVSRNGEAGSTERKDKVPECSHRERRAWMRIDSGTVAMKVGIR